MPIEGKRKYSFYLDEENTELVKSFVDQTRMSGGMSALVDELMKVLADTLRASGVDKRPMNYAKVVRIFFEGIKRV